MTEQNMKQMYDNLIEKGFTEKAKAISDIPRYAHFKEVKKVETKSKEKK